MPCYHPQTVYRKDPGPGVSFVEIPGKTGLPIEIPCGRCIGCLLERSRQWSVRIMHEKSMHDENSFLTLTYNDDNVPEDFSLDHCHFQKFMKKLRKHVKNVSYYMCGEYGEQTKRPHYHVCLFGADFNADRKIYSRNNGNLLYNSDTLNNIWGFGDCIIGDLTIQSAAYVARYVLNKRYNDLYEIVDPETGEVFNRKPPYCKMSLNPAIGKRWIEKYHPEVYLNAMDNCYAGQVIQRPPRYYDKVVEDKLGIGLDDVRKNRIDKADKQKDDSTVERLAVRERVKLAQISKLKRS